MKSSVLIAAVMSCSLFWVPTSAHSCGESLFRVGKGVSYREYTAPLPGSILVVANTEAELAMVARLAAAGHEVAVVSDASLIGHELVTRKFDIVLAYYSARVEVESQIASSSATYIPVAMSDTAERKEARKDYRHSLKSNDSVKTFLRTIHRSLKDNA